MIEALHVKHLLEAWSWLAFAHQEKKVTVLGLFVCRRLERTWRANVIPAHNRPLHDIRLNNTRMFHFPNRSHRERDMLFTWYIIEPLSRDGACIMHDVIINTALHTNYSFHAGETVQTAGSGEPFCLFGERDREAMIGERESEWMSESGQIGEWGIDTGLCARSKREKLE